MEYVNKFSNPFPAAQRGESMIKQIMDPQWTVAEFELVKLNDNGKLI